MATCPRCGIDEESISEHDALDAARTFPGRYRRAVDGLTPEQFAVVSGGWWAGGSPPHGGKTLERPAAALTTVLDDPGVDVAPFPDESAAPATASADASAALDRIDRAAAALVAAG